MLEAPQCHPRGVVTPLLEALRAATPAEREKIAKLAATSVNYLYQVAICRRPSPRVRWSIAVEDAIATVHRDSGGRVPLVTARDIAAMCAIVLAAE